MKCGAHIIKGPNRKGDLRVKRTVSWEHREQDPSLLELRDGETHVSVCDGDISVEVKAEDEPDWGGHYAVLSITYKCSKCGRAWFEELPNDGEELSEFLTTVLMNMSEEEAELLREIKRQRRIAVEERFRQA